MAGKVLNEALLDEAARFVEPEGRQNFSEVREILEANTDYAAKFLEYRKSLNEMMQALVDPSTKITVKTETECKRLDKEQDTLVQTAPDQRIAFYLTSLGHLLGVKDKSDQHYQAVQNARARRSFFQSATQYIHPQGGSDFQEIKRAFQKDSIYVGEFIAYHDASDKFKKEMVETRSKINAERLALLNQLHAELVNSAPNDTIKKYLEGVHEKLKQMNEKMG